jgi:hypothetical protein
MRETEIVRGLGKARTKRNAQLNSFATGMVPEEPSLIGFAKDRLSALRSVLTPAPTAQAPQAATPTPLQAIPNAITDNSGLTGAATTAIQDHNKANADALNTFADGMVPAEPVRTLRGMVVQPAPKPAQPAAQDSTVQPAAQPQPQTLRGYGNDLRAMTTNDFSSGTPFVNGPGTGTSDSVPAHLSHGEAVLPSKTVAAVGPQNLARLIQQTNDGIAPKKGLRTSQNHFAVGDVPVPDATAGQGFVQGAKNVAQNALNGVRSFASSAADAAKGAMAGPPPAAPVSTAPVNYDTPTYQRNAIASGTPVPEGTAAPIAKVPAAPVASAPPAAPAVGSSALKRGLGFAGNAAGVVGGGVGTYYAAKDMIKNGVDLNNATDLAGSAAAATGGGLGLAGAAAGAAAPFAAPLAVGGGSFLAGKAAGGALVEGLLKDKIDSTIGQNKNIPNDAEVKRIIAANPDGNLARYMRSQKDGGGFTPDALPSVAPAAAPVLPASQQMSPAQTLRVNAQINNGSLRAEDLAPGTGYVTRSDGTMGTKFNAQPFGQAAEQTAKQPAQAADPAADFQARLRQTMLDPTAPRSMREQASQQLASENALEGAKYGSDASLMGNRLNNMYAARVANGKAVEDKVRTLNADTGKDAQGNATSNPNGPAANAAMGHLTQTLAGVQRDGVPLTIQDMSDQEVDTFNTMLKQANASDGWNEEWKGKFINAIQGNHPHKSGDVRQYGATGKDKGAVYPQYTDRQGNRVGLRNAINPSGDFIKPTLNSDAERAIDDQIEQSNPQTLRRAFSVPSSTADLNKALQQRMKAAARHSN